MPGLIRHFFKYRPFLLEYSYKIKNMDKKTKIERTILAALKEDIGSSDVTSQAIIPRLQTIRGVFLAKEPGTISGIDIVKILFRLLDKNIRFRLNVQNGSTIAKGQILARIEGNGRAILSGERMALNFLQRMSGIATATKRYVNAVAGTKAVILDTRKTAPGLRIFDKQAVRDGGGQNHRFGLYDMFLIKDNHIAAAGSIGKAVAAAQKNNRRKLPIEVEVKNFAELDKALALPIDRIMLDNMDVARMRQAVKITNGRVPLEASGMVDINTVTAIAKTGVDFISNGALTHSVKALDISLEIENQ